MARSRRSTYSSAARANPGLINARNAQVKAARGLTIDAQGLAELRRDMRKLSKDTDKLLRKELREALKPVLSEARANTPRGRSGKLVRSLRLSVTQRSISIGSTLPYAPVIHWGGSTGRGHRPNSPWSGSILVRPSLFISDALESHETDIIEGIGDAVERAFLGANTF